MRFFKGGRSGDIKIKKKNNDPDPKTNQSKDPVGQLVYANDDVVDKMWDIKANSLDVYDGGN